MKQITAMKTPTLTPLVKAKKAVIDTHKKTPLRVAVITPLSKEKRGPDVFFCAEALCSLGHEVRVLAVGDSAAQEYAYKFSNRFPDQFQLMEAAPSNTTKILKWADVAFFPMEPTMAQMRKIIKNSAIPVLPQGCLFTDYNPIAEEGNAFTFAQQTPWHMLAALLRAAENRRFAYDWNRLKKNLKKLKP